MKTIAKLGLTSLTVFSTSLAIGVAVVSHQKENVIANASEVSVTTNITSEMLANTVLEDFDLGKENPDKKFRISLPHGRYIDGALLFNDCSHQYVGSTLGDTFGIYANNGRTSGDAYNFNVLFSIESTTGLSVNFVAETNQADANQQFVVRIKYATVTGDFYEALDNAVYQEVVNGYSPCIYNNVIDRKTYNFSTTTVSSSFSYNYSGSNIVCFQFNYFGSVLLPLGRSASCTLSDLTLKYTCNR